MGFGEVESTISPRAAAFSVENLLKKYDRFKSQNGITVELCGSELWERFHRLHTEMIVTKAGRRMFPTLKLRFYGLSFSSSYIIYMDVIPFGNFRYRYNYEGSRWVEATKWKDTTFEGGLYIHPVSPASGQLWTSQGHIAFDKVKLTNNMVQCHIVRGQISLLPLHKYQPRIHILEVPRTVDLPSTALTSYILSKKQWAHTFIFPQTAFIAVTAYHNQEIVRLKIRNNPFAKGFREASEKREKNKKAVCPFHDSRTQCSTRKCCSHQKVPVKVIIPTTLTADISYQKCPQCL